jgi:thiol-disulfide isomerase/thioredoxin
MNRLLPLALVIFLLSPLAAADKAALPKVEKFSLSDALGTQHSAGEWNDSKGAVVFVLGTECPVANGYAPLMQRLADAYSPKGLKFYGLHPDPDVTAKMAADHATDYAIKFPILLDGQQQLASQMGIKVLGEVVVLSPKGQVVYRGRIDDRFSTSGKRRDAATSNELELALQAVLAGKQPAAAQPAFGCPIPKLR